MNDVQAEQAIRQAEERRCRYLMDDDLEGLETVVAPDLVHVHATGVVDDKANYLRGVRERFRFLSVARPEMNVRVLGATAIVTGRLEQRIQMRDTSQLVDLVTFTTQVWTLTNGTWRQCSFQATRI